MKHFLIVSLIVLILAASLVPVAQAAPSAGNYAVVTWVKSVRMYNSRSAVSYCTINLRNGRVLTNVWGEECEVKPGTQVTLYYQETKTRLGTRSTLISWSLGGGNVWGR